MNCNNTRCSTCSQVKTSVLIFSFLFSYFNARAREFSGNSRFLSQLKSFYSLCQNTCQLRLYGTIHFVFFFFSLSSQTESIRYSLYSLADFKKTRACIIDELHYYL